MKENSFITLTPGREINIIDEETTLMTGVSIIFTDVLGKIS
jgi:hypothetical protein